MTHPAPLLTDETDAAHVFQWIIRRKSTNRHEPTGNYLNGYHHLYRLG
jgi:hypothetical protein